MSNKMKFLKAVYWIGALVDTFMLIPMLSPEIGGAMFGIPHFQPGPDYRYAMGIGASLMAGWTALLVWGHLEPIARRSVLLLTTIPVVIGMVCANIYAVASGLIPFERAVPIFVLQAILAALFIAAYFVAGAMRGSSA
jgi:hypothetical protein